MADGTTRSVEGQPLAEEDIQHFDSSFLKITKDGAQVLSNTLEPGERLASEQPDKEQAKRTVGEDHLPKEGEALTQAGPGVVPGPNQPPSAADKAVQEQAKAADQRAEAQQGQQTPAQQQAQEPGHAQQGAQGTQQGAQPKQ